MLSWKLLMATDFMNVAAHSVEFVRCIKVSFRTHPVKHCFGIFVIIQNHHARVFSLTKQNQKNTRLRVIRFQYMQQSFVA